MVACSGYFYMGVDRRGSRMYQVEPQSWETKHTNGHNIDKDSCYHRHDLCSVFSLQRTRPYRALERRRTKRREKCGICAGRVVLLYFCWIAPCFLLARGRSSAREYSPSISGDHPASERDPWRPHRGSRTVRRCGTALPPNPTPYSRDLGTRPQKRPVIGRNMPYFGFAAAVTTGKMTYICGGSGGSGSCSLLAPNRPESAMKTAPLAKRRTRNKK